MTQDAEDTLSLIRDQASRLLQKYAQPEHLKALLDCPGGFDRALWDAAIEQGWPAIALPEEAGGIGLGWKGLATLMEEAGRLSVSLPLVGNAVAASALLATGNASLIERHAAALVGGQRIACLAFAEPGQADVRQRPAACVIDGRLSGRKAFSAFAAVADLALLHAEVDGVIRLVLVALDQDGVTRQTAPSLDNARAGAALGFDGAAAWPLAADGQEIDKALALAALATASEQIGGASACLAMARDYALERKAFGQPISRFQAIKHKLADMYWRIEIARGCAIDALEALDQGNSLWPALAAAARLAAIEAYEFAARENIQTHGGLGVTWEAMPHHYYRRARSLALELGSTQSWREYLLAEAGFDAAAA